MACTDIDLESLATAAQQLQHMEKLDLGAIMVGICFQRRAPPQRLH